MDDAQKRKGADYIPMVLVMVPARTDGDSVVCDIGGQVITMWPEHFPAEARADLLGRVGADLETVRPENIEVLETEYPKE